jgi:hypothetical protein
MATRPVGPLYVRVWTLCERALSLSDPADETPIEREAETGHPQTEQVMVERPVTQPAGLWTIRVRHIESDFAQ